MGRQPEQDNEDWRVPDDSVLKELSPLQETHQRSLFQRIARQRAVYFADVEYEPDSGEDEDSAVGINGSPKSTSEKDGGQREDCLPPSAFADLSTWCCDAFLPAHPNSMSPEERFTRLAAIVDQPTMILSLLAPLPVHIADLPTGPDLRVVSAPASSKDLSCRSAFSFAAGKLWSVLVRFCQRLLHVCRIRRPRKKRLPVSKGHELLLERLRERQQKGISAVMPTRPGQRRPRQIRLPADRLLS